MKFLRIVAATIFAISCIIPTVAQADSVGTKEGGRLTYSCPSRDICYLISWPQDVDLGNGEAVVTAYVSANGIFSKSASFDISSDIPTSPNGEFSRSGFSAGLHCFSVGNCEGLIRIDTGGSLGKRNNDSDLIKPINSATYLISQISSEWQNPVLIPTLNMKMTQNPQTFYRTGDIWCASHGNCVAIGNTSGAKKSQSAYPFSQYLGLKPYVASQVNGVWGKPQYLMNKKLDNRGSHFLALRCQDITNCTIYGEFVPSVVEETRLLRNYGIAGYPNVNTKTMSGNAAVPLGLTLTMKNGNWGSPVVNRGAFSGNPYPKGDPRFLQKFPTDRYESPLSPNAIGCIKARNCVLEP
jgi:hypothetical protein